jgi:signal transduction histidine kinase
MGERVRERAQRLEATAAHATELLHNLLDAATIEAQSLRLAITPCEVDALLAEVIEVHTPLAEEKRLKLRTRPLGSSFWIHCDRTRLIQALTNLLGNALKFTCEGGEITLAAELDGPSVRFSVSDTGAGIAPRDIPRLFDRYWRPQEARGAGTGLGFYIVKGIVEAHGGHISVDSNPGVGTTFTITIPVEP